MPTDWYIRLSKPCNIDARGLEPPQPLMLVIAALDELQADESIHLLIDREPHPLYRMLAHNGYVHSTELQDDGDFLVRIWAVCKPA